MSMRNYATEGFGLVLSSEEALAATIKYMEERGEDTNSIQSYWDVYEFGEFLGLNVYSNFSGEAFVIGSDNVWDWGRQVPVDDAVIILELDKYPMFFEKTYNNKQEIIEEVKGKIAKYLPDDFDYDGHLCHVIGTVWG